MVDLLCSFMLLQVCNPIIMKYVYTQQVSILSIQEIWFFIIFFSMLLLLRCNITGNNLYYVNRELLQVGIIQKCFLSPRHHGDCSTKNKHCLKRDEWKSEHSILQATANKTTESWIKIMWKEYCNFFNKHLICKYRRAGATAAWVRSILPVLQPTGTVPTDLHTQLT